MAKKLGRVIIGINRAVRMAMRCIGVKMHLALVLGLFVHLFIMSVYFVGMMFLKISSSISIHH